MPPSVSLSLGLSHTASEALPSFHSTPAISPPSFVFSTSSSSSSSLLYFLPIPFPSSLPLSPRLFTTNHTLPCVATFHIFPAHALNILPLAPLTRSVIQTQLAVQTKKKRESICVKLQKKPLLSSSAPQHHTPSSPHIFIKNGSRCSYF